MQFRYRSEKGQQKHWKNLKFEYLPNEKITVKFLIEYARKYWNGKQIREEGIMLVIDEAQLLFNAREWAKTGRADWLSFSVSIENTVTISFWSRSMIA